MDELLDFSSDIGEDEDDDDTPLNSSLNHHLLRRHNPRPSFPLLPFSDGDHTPPFPELPEEELEWISNKDAFPMIESLVDIMPNHPSIPTTDTFNTTSNSNYNSNHQSPISVLENSSSSFTSNASHGSINNIVGGNTNRNGRGSMVFFNLASDFKVPGARARSKIGRKRRDLEGQQFFCWSVHEKKAFKKPVTSKMSSTIGRKCLHCGTEKTPQWRAGPLGPKTLCNACGVRYKSGRLCDEYRPASSPTFSSKLHSNSHRKIVEMRRQKTPLNGSVLKPAEMG